ncbi:MAG: transposase, partial [Rhodanobacteraceae bacterium]|nr:transposase [Rhodanobacteraceae bacterium]
ALVDYTGRQVRPDKRGAITGLPPAILGRLDYRPEQWARQVMAVGSSFNRAMGQVESLIEKARAMGQCWLRGVAVARALARA